MRRGWSSADIHMEDCYGPSLEISTYLGRDLSGTRIDRGDPVLWNSDDPLYWCHPPSHFLPLLSGLFSFFRSPSCHGSDSIFSRNGCAPLPQNSLLKRKTIRSAGLLIRQFHQAGFFHGDLQLKKDSDSRGPTSPY